MLAWLASAWLCSKTDVAASAAFLGARGSGGGVSSDVAGEEGVESEPEPTDGADGVFGGLPAVLP